jgi:hypothetical protein
LRSSSPSGSSSPASSQPTLGLRGRKANSLTVAVCVLRKEFNWVARTGALAMISIVGAATCVVILNAPDEGHFWYEIPTFVVLGVGTCAIFWHAHRLRGLLAIGEEDVVGGEVRVRGGGAEIDLTMIQPEARGSSARSALRSSDLEMGIARKPSGMSGDI